MDLTTITVVVPLAAVALIAAGAAVHLLFRDLQRTCRVHSDTIVRLNPCFTTIPDADPCCVCMQTPGNVQLSCGHTELCITCALQLKKCPLCRQRIAQISLTVFY